MSELDETVETIVAAVLRRLRERGGPSAHPARSDEPEACTPAERPIHEVADPANAAQIARLVPLTSSRIGVGSAGNRFRTDLYLQIREGHADARDAVHSEVPDGWATAHGLVPLVTRCPDRHTYLLHPNLGRRLDDASRAEVAKASGSDGDAARAGAGGAPDVQIIVGDGLSPNAIVQNGKDTLNALKEALRAANLSTGVDYFVKYARIGVADEIGVLSRARASVILVGERPGLGTGDSLSVYIAVKPRIDQDNAEKNCISNVRPIGIAPHEAAAQTVKILQRGFEKGVGGVALGVGWGRS